MAKVSPSLLAADFLHLESEIRRMADAGADFMHFDVMDGMFVPNISFGLPVLKAASKCGVPMDVHMMVTKPERYIERFAEAGARIITVHAEATDHLHRVLTQIRACGCLAGVAMNPATSPECLRYVMGDFDLALVMTVNPGFGGQKLIPACLDKVRDVRAMLTRAGVNAYVEVDGGVTEANAEMVVHAGVDLIVAGSAAYGAKDAKAFIDKIHSL